MKTDIILCECGSCEHQILIHKDEEDSEVYLSIHLITYQNFFQRLWIGIKYAFGYTSRYGQWDSIILEKEHADQLQEVVNYLRKKQ